VYEIPPATSQSNPSKGKLATNGFMAKMITQPINTYIIVEIKSYFPVKNSFKTIPVNASPQVIPKIIQPIVPLSVIRVNGV